MKFGQLTEYNTRSIFLEKSYKKWGGETTARPLSCYILLTDQISLSGCLYFTRYWIS